MGHAVGGWRRLERAAVVLHWGHGEGFMTRMLAASAVTLLLALLLGLGAWPTAAQGREFFVNTTVDIVPLQPTFCIASNPCTFRAALERSQDARGGTVTACHEGGEPCPPGRSPLLRSDPNYNPATGKWYFRFDVATFTPFLVDVDGVGIDLARYVSGWQGPQHNRFVVDSGTERIHNHLFAISAADGVFSGFEIRGAFLVAALVLRDGALENQIGPGLVLAGIRQGAGILIRGSDVTRNRVVGSWCGITGDGSVVDPVQDDCIVLRDGANLNTIGGEAPADRNILAATDPGNGVSINGDATRSNVVRGNYIGTDPSGTKAIGLDSGVGLFLQASDNLITGNLISGNRASGVFAADASTPFGRTQNVVEGNLIGTAADGERPLPNGGFGARIEGESKDVKLFRNTIRYNGAGGVLICGADTRNNTISENRITDNRGSGIQICPGANGGVGKPTILEATQFSASGTACTGCRVELYSDPFNQADRFEGAAVADGTGAWRIDNPSGFTYQGVAATATDGRSTSALSAAVVWVPDYTPTPTATLRSTPTPLGPTPTGPTPTPSPMAVTPTTTPDGPMVVLGEIFLPWLGRAALR